MLNSQEFKAFIPSILPEKSESFYRDVLGLSLVGKDSFGLDFDANGTPLRITFVQEFTPQPFTVAGWNIADIAACITSLKSKGVSFEIYGFMPQDDQGIWTAPSGTKVAWFKDADGNLLSLSQMA